MISLVTGSSLAKETQGLADDPYERLLKAYDEALEELELAKEKGPDKNALKMSNKRFGSLQKLMAISKALQ